MTVFVPSPTEDYYWDEIIVIKVNNEKELKIKIETAREVLYKEIEENLEIKGIHKASEELDKLIVDYLIR